MDISARDGALRSYSKAKFEALLVGLKSLYIVVD